MKILKVLSLFCALLLLNSVVAQESQNTDNVKAVFNILYKEISKGYKNVKSEADLNAKLKLLSKVEAAELRLSDTPTDAFYIKSTTSSLLISSLSLDGLRNGVYWYLHQLGYRYYYPNKIWTVIPSL